MNSRVLSFRNTSGFIPGVRKNPAIEQERISIIDTIRGFALLGILLVNIQTFADSYDRLFDLRIFNEYSGPNYYTWWVVNGFLDGSMKGLFSMLFGAGAILYLTRIEKKSLPSPLADYYYRRMIWLFLFGILNAYVLLWPGDILYAYAWSGMFLYPLRNIKAKYFLALGLLILVISDSRSTLQLYKQRETRQKGESSMALRDKSPGLILKEDHEAAIKKWEELKDKNDPKAISESVEKDRKEYQKGYRELLSHVKSVNIKNGGQLPYDFFIRDIMAFMLLGIALYKMGIFTGRGKTSLYWLLLLGGYGIGFSLGFWRLSSTLASNFDTSNLADKMILNLSTLRRTCMAVGHVSLLMLFHKYNLFSTGLRWLAKTGQMAFTNYLMQSILCGIIFYGAGFGLYGKLERYEWYYVVAALWLFQIAFSNIWLKYFLVGPFEWLWRSLTYWQKQPMRKTKVSLQEPTPYSLLESEPLTRTIY